MEKIGRMNHRSVDHHIVVDKLRRPRRVRDDSADGARHQKHILGAVGAKPIVDRRLVAQIQLFSRCGQDVLESFTVQAPQNRRSDETGVASDIHSGVSI